MFELEFYSAEDNKEPVADFLDSLDAKMAAKIVGLLDVLSERGPEVRLPYSRYLEDGICELRCIFGNNIVRLLYFFYYNNRIIITNGFVKKTQKTPTSEIKLAKKRRSDWIERNK